VLDKTTRVNLLYDFYAPLLTEKQKEYMELYYLEDYSLGEVADVKNVSRQAVYDNIKRTENVLEAYEEKLLLYEKFNKRKQLFDTLTLAISEQKDKETMLQIVKQLENIE